jgi:hypothetical protein
MADTQIILKLTAERHRIEGYIESLEKKIADAKRDLIHVNCTIRLFQIQDDPKQFPAHMACSACSGEAASVTACLWIVPVLLLVIRL